jgi:pimeloyl-ACP methyl ester carboxylesterase
MTTRIQPQDKTVAVNGINLHYLDWGNVGQPVVLLVHGLRGHAHSWDDVSAALCRDFHVLALDQRGRGDSDWASDGDYSTNTYADDLEGFCRSLKLDRLILVGHSMGGRNSMAFGGRCPELLQKLVIVDIGPVGDPRGGQRITQELSSVPEEFDSFEAVVEHMARQNRFASDAVLRRRLQYATRELPSGKIGWKYDLVTIRDQRRNGTSAPPVDLWPALSNIKCPTLIVRGAESDILSQDETQRMLDTLADAQVVEIPRAGHMVFEDNPQDFNAALSRFLS